MKIIVNILLQQMTLLDAAGQIVRRYSVSSAKNGTGQERGSYCTPLGKHIVPAKNRAGRTGQYRICPAASHWRDLYT